MILHIPDCHVEPGQDLSRFALLNKLIVDKRPDNIIIAGDFISLSSLSHWDVSSRGLMEGRRYAEDIAHGNTALNLMFKSTVLLQRKQREQKIKLYRPSVYYLIGNHEEWLDKYLAKYPELSGSMSIEKDLHLDKRGIKYVDKIILNNIVFQHALIGDNGKALAPKHTAQKAIEMHSMSSVTAHTHRFEVRCGSDHSTGNLRVAMSGGCFFDGIPHYIPKALPPLWRGVQLIYPLKNGFDFETISIERMKTIYG